MATALQTVTRLAAGLLAVVSAAASWAGTTAEWKGGGGAWENAALWGGTPPSRTLVNHVSVADGGNSLASLTLDGPSLTVPEDELGGESFCISKQRFPSSSPRFVPFGDSRMTIDLPARSFSLRVVWLGLLQSARLPWLLAPPRRN